MVDPSEAELARLKRQDRNNLTKHVLAVLLVIGFYGLVGLVLAGFVDLENNALIAFLGTLLGYAAMEMKQVVQHYMPVENPGKHSEED